MDLLNSAPKVTSQVNNLVEDMKSPKYKVQQEMDETVIEADDEYSPERLRDSEHKSNQKFSSMNE